MKNILTSRVAVITGGSRGIGFGIAQQLAAEGFDLVIIARREESKFEGLDELREYGQKIFYCQGDIGSTDNIEPIVNNIYSHVSQVNLLINNAGIAPRERKDVLQTTVDSYREVMDTNLTGPFFLTQRIANRMVESKKEHPEFEALIVNISSISATVASVNRAEYCISKAGLSMLTKLFACRLGEFDIPVYEVQPGITKTDMTKMESEKYDKMLEEGLCLTARWGFPKDVGKIVASLSRGDFLYSTGQIFIVDGGLSFSRL